MPVEVVTEISSATSHKTGGRAFTENGRRNDHGYTHAKVAELMGGSRTIYNGIENGKVNIK